MSGETLGFSESLSRLKESFLYAAANGGNLDDCNQLIGILYYNNIIIIYYIF